MWLILLTPLFLLLNKNDDADGLSKYLLILFLLFMIIDVFKWCLLVWLLRGYYLLELRIESLLLIVKCDNLRYFLLFLLLLLMKYGLLLFYGMVSRFGGVNNVFSYCCFYCWGYILLLLVYYSDYCSNLLL